MTALLLLALHGCQGDPPADTGTPWTPLRPGCFEQRGHTTGDELLVYDLAWSPDGAQVVTGSTNLLRLYDVSDDGRALAEVGSAWNDFRFISTLWADEGRLVVAPSGPIVYLFAPSAEGLVLVHESPRVDGELQRAMLSPDGRHLLTCDTAGVVRLHGLALDPPAVTHLAELPVHERCTRVAWSPSGRLAWSVGHEGILGLLAVDPDAGTVRLAHGEVFAEETGEAIFLSDTEAVAGSFGDRNEMWWLTVDPEAETYTVRATDRRHRSGFGAVELDPSGRWLVTGDHDHTVHLYDWTPGAGLTPVADLPDDGRGVHSVRWSPDGRLLARTASNVDRLDILAVGDCVAE